MLELMGHQPSLAHDGLEALEAAKTQQPDVIMLDIGLPGMNGYDVCRELRKDPRFVSTADDCPDRLGPGARPAAGAGSDSITTSSPR